MQSSVGAALEPALLHKPAVPASWKIVIPALANERSNLAHPVPIPDLGERVIPQISNDFLPAPVVNAHENVAVVKNARD